MFFFLAEEIREPRIRDGIHSVISCVSTSVCQQRPYSVKTLSFLWGFVLMIGADYRAVRTYLWRARSLTTDFWSGA